MERTKLRTRSGDVLYRAICDCGNECLVRSCRVKKWTKCKTCASRENINKKLSRAGNHNGMWRGSRDIPGTYLGNMKRRALKIGIPCTVTIQDLQSLFDKQQGLCSYSGVNISFGKNTSASLDRINSSLGYEPGNIQWLHKRVNWIKNTLDESEFLYWVRLIAKKSEVVGSQ